MRESTCNQAPSSTYDLAENATPTWICSHYPAFDGLRAIAITMVVVVHYLIVAKPSTSQFELWTGVDLFFVLSGFLITGILFDSSTSNRYFRNFYIRRALRILPLSYGVFLLILIMTPLLHLHYSLAIWSNPLYVMNLFIKGTLLDQNGNPTVVQVPFIHSFLCFGHLWSLCVEEQFYIVWPLVVWLFPRRTILMNLCVAAIALTVALRIYLFLHDPYTAKFTHYLYYSTYTRCDTLLCGAWIALWLRGSKPSRTTLRRIAFSACGFAAAAIAALTLRFHADLTGSSSVMFTVGYTLVALCASGVLLLSLDATSRLHRALLNPILQRIGNLSYGIYFLHDLFIDSIKQIAEALQPHHLALLIIPIGFALSYAAASLSYRFWELPFLKLKDVFAPTNSATAKREDLRTLAQPSRGALSSASHLSTPA